MIVVGLDLSLRSTGCVAVPHTFAAALDWGSVRHCAITTESLPQGASVRERTGRLVAVAVQIERWLRNDRADVVALEMQAFRQRQAHARELGELTGIVCAELLPLGLPIVLVTASAARKTLLGRCPATGAKGAVSEMLRRMGAPWTDPDRSDAYAVANHVLSMHGHPAVTVGRDEP